jgi:hypothetical protein
MTEKQTLGFKPSPRLEQIGDNMPSERRIVYIAPNDGLILPHCTNPGPMEYSEGTQLLTPQNRRLKSKDNMPQPTREARLAHAEEKQGDEGAAVL